MMALQFRDRRGEPARDARTPATAPAHDDLAAYFLGRLTRLARKAALLGRYLVPGDRRMHLLNHAILATYDDCRALGRGDEARAILRALRLPQGAGRAP